MACAASLTWRRTRRRRRFAAPSAALSAPAPGIGRYGPPGRDDHGGAPPPGPDRSRQARNRRWWRRGAVVIGCAAVVGIAAGVVLGLDGGTKTPPAGRASSPGAGKGPVAVLPALSAPGCSTAVAAAALSRVRSADVSVGSQPFGVVAATSRSSRWRTPSLGQISTGLLAREFGLAPDGKIALVTNSNSGQVQAIDLSTLP